MQCQGGMILAAAFREYQKSTQEAHSLNLSLPCISLRAFVPRSKEYEL